MCKKLLITMVQLASFFSFYTASFRELVGNFQIFLSPFDVRLFIVVLMIFNGFLFLIWGADKVCLFYKNRRRLRRKKEKFTLLGEY
jgi:hypothetical protein